MSTSIRHLITDQELYFKRDATPRKVGRPRKPESTDQVLAPGNKDQASKVPDLSYDYIRNRDLRGADLRNMYLHGTVFSHCKLARADFSGAHLKDSVFIGCLDLHEAVGLELVVHDGFSAIDWPCFERTAQALPHSFLIGTGYSGYLLDKPVLTESLRDEWGTHYGPDYNRNTEPWVKAGWVVEDPSNEI